MSKIAGVVKVLSTVHWNTLLIWDDIFPKHITIEPIIMLRKDNMIDVEISSTTLDLYQIKNGTECRS